MSHVDALSRAPIDDTPNANIETNEDEILMHQKSDENLKIIIEILEKKRTRQIEIGKRVSTRFLLKERVTVQKGD